MILRISILILVILFSNTAHSQIQTESSFYLEGMGHGIVYSFNYEKIKLRDNRKSDHSYFIGIYVNPIDGGTISRSIGIPVGINRLRKIKKNYLELGLGLTVMYGIETYTVGSAYLYTRLAYRKNFKRTYLRFSVHPIYIIDTNLFNRPEVNNFAGEWAFWPGVAFGFHRRRH